MKIDVLFYVIMFCICGCIGWINAETNNWVFSSGAIIICCLLIVCYELAGKVDHDRH